MVVSDHREASASLTVRNGAGRNAVSGGNQQGAAYVFKYDGTNWAQEAYIKAPNNDVSDQFGTYVAISGDTLAASAYLEDSNQNTITNGATASADNSISSSGAVYVFTRSGVTWTQEAYIKPPNPGSSDRFGARVAISGDHLMVAAPYEDSSLTGVTNSSFTENENVTDSGAVYLFERSGTTWSFAALIKSPNPDYNRLFGANIDISGNYAVIGESKETSSGLSEAGVVYIYKYTNGLWSKETTIGNPNPIAYEQFGNNVKIDATRIIAGTNTRNILTNTITDGTNIPTTGTTTALPAGGAILFSLDSSGIWYAKNFFQGSNTKSGDLFGNSCTISGNNIAIGATRESNGATGAQNASTVTEVSTAYGSGAVYIFEDP